MAAWSPPVPSKNPDLFWGLRGGGGNFGVVTSFLFRLHPVDTVVAGPTFWPLERSADVMRWYREFIVAAPEDLNGFFAFLTVPPVEPYPAALQGQKVCGVVWCYTGAVADADAAFKPVREFGPPLMHGVQPMPFTALQSAFDALYPPGHQWYWRADFVNELSDAAIAEHARFGADHADAAVDDAPVPDRRCGASRQIGRHGLCLSRCQLGRGHGRRQPRRAGRAEDQRLGQELLGCRCTRIRPAAPT